jgi:hypothetical protein
LADSNDADEELEILKRKITRRAAIGKAAVAGAAIGVAIIAGAGGYLAGSSVSSGKSVTEIMTQTGPGSTVTVGGATGPVSTVTVGPTTSQVVSLGATPAERAVNGVKALQAAGKIPSGATIKFLEAAFRAGNMTPKEGLTRTDPFTGKTIQTSINMLKKWEDLTGIPVSMDLLNDLQLYDKAISEATTKAGTWDFLGQRIDFLVDFINAGVALDLSAFETQYQPDIRTGNCPVTPVFAQGYYTSDGKYWGFPGCGDWFSYYNRRDLVTSPKLQSAFETQFGYPMPVQGPDTWDQVLDMAKFFDGYKGTEQTLPDGTTATLRGCYFFRDTWFSNIEFRIRFLELGGLLFDSNQNVALDNQITRKALSDMKALVPYQAKDAFTSSWPTMYPNYANKQVFQTISWASVAQFSASGPVGGKGFGVYLTPGYLTSDNKLIRVTVMYDQTSYIVEKYGKLTSVVPDVPFLFGQWLTDPEISTEELANPGAISDYFRTCHGQDERMIGTFYAVWPPNPGVEPGRRGAAEAFDTQFGSLVGTWQLAGLHELQDLWGTQMNAYFTDVQDIDTTVKNMQTGTDAVMDRLGRPAQYQRCLYVQKTFPPALKALHGFS